MAYFYMVVLPQILTAMLAARQTKTDYNIWKMEEKRKTRL